MSTQEIRTVDDLPQPEYDGDIDVNELQVDGDNPNEMPSELFETLKDRMLERGWISGPILADTDGVIADGQHRWEAAQEIGLVEVPVKQYDVDDAGRRILRQEANKIRGEHDPDDDVEEYLLIAESDRRGELEELLDNSNEDTDLEKLLEESGPDEQKIEDAFGDLPSGERDPIRQKTFTLSEMQVETVDQALDRAKDMGDFEEAVNDNSNGNALARVCRKFNEAY